jgi:hypothetical protein
MIPAPGDLFDFMAGERPRMPKRHDFLEGLSEDDPNHQVGKRFYLGSWAKSHGLVAAAFSGGLSISDFIEGCATTFEQGAEAIIEFQEGASISAKCRELDRAAKASIRLFSKALVSESKRLGKANVTRAIEEFSSRVTVIAARAKQQILDGELARDVHRLGTVHQSTTHGTVNSPLKQTGASDVMASLSGPSSEVPPAQNMHLPKETRNARRPARRNIRYQAIDEKLVCISEARPKNHEEVFRYLDDRKIAIPNRKLFKSAGGWLKGFHQDPHAASAWLSQRWARLGLPAFPRGPKK